MRKNYLILTLFGFYFGVTNAQNANFEWSFSENNLIGFSDDYSSNIYSVDLGGVYKITPKLGIGAGVGIGLGNPVKYDSMWKLDHEMKEDGKAVVSVYARGKYAFSHNPTHIFSLLDLGYNYSSVEDYSGTDFNPYGAFFRPAVGVEFKLGESNTNLYIAVGYQNQFTTTDRIELKYDSLINKYVYDGHKHSNNAFGGLYLTLGVNFE